MGHLALSWSIAGVAALVAAVSTVRLATTRGEMRFAAGGDLLMGSCMAAMSLPATVAWYASYGMWWAGAFVLLALGGMLLAIKRTRTSGWRHGRQWLHLIVGSFGMVIVTLAMTSTPSGPVLALNSSDAGMPGMEHTTGTRSMNAEGSMPGMNMPGMATTAVEGTGSSGFLWRLVIAAFAAYFLLSIAASVWARVRGTGNTRRASGQGWGRWLLAMPDTLIVFLASLTLAIWDKARAAERTDRGRRRKLGAAPDAALAAHIGMGGSMAAMLMTMAI